MDTWLDTHAKRAAARSTTGAPGISRRRFLGRTAVVAGVAWTAPTVLSAAPAWAGLSTCTTLVCGSTCCTTVGMGTCNGGACPGTTGGFCTNNGQGVSGCLSNSVHCNGVKDNNICGGVGAQCDDTGDCASGLTCTTGSGNKKTCTSGARQAAPSGQGTAPGTQSSTGSTTPSGTAGTSGSSTPSSSAGTSGTSGTTGPSTSPAPTG